VIGLAFVIAYVALDRSTVYFQIWTSAWYPPAGLAVAFLTAFGLSYVPWMLLAGVIVGTVDYHFHLSSYQLFLGVPIIVAGYSGAAAILRHRHRTLKEYQPLHEVLFYVCLALAASFCVATAGTWMVVLDHLMPRESYLRGALNWWAGDAGALICFAPFLQIVVIPPLARFYGDSILTIPVAPVDRRASTSINQRVRQMLEIAAQSASIVIVLGLAFGWDSTH
jgi:integral membrane sensor domain MASE1